MRKSILKISAVALLIGGLAFNFVLSSNKSAEQNFDLKQMIRMNIAQGEGTYRGGCLPEASGCPYLLDTHKKYYAP